MQAYLSTMADLGADTWIMHGTLLGWWWNRRVGLCLGQEACGEFSQLADHALGFGHRRPSFAIDHGIPRKLLQHDDASLQFADNASRWKKLHARDQPGIRQWFTG